MQIHIIADNETVTGFVSVGVQGTVATAPEEVAQALQQALQIDGIGLILISERLAGYVREQIDRLTFEAHFPLVIEIPDRKGPLKDRIDIHEIVRRAVGVKI